MNLQLLANGSIVSDRMFLRVFVRNARAGAGLLYPEPGPAGTSWDPETPHPDGSRVVLQGTERGLDAVPLPVPLPPGGQDPLGVGHRRGQAGSLGPGRIRAVNVRHTGET